MVRVRMRTNVKKLVSYGTLEKKSDFGIAARSSKEYALEKCFRCRSAKTSTNYSSKNMSSNFLGTERIASLQKLACIANDTGKRWTVH